MTFLRYSNINVKYILLLTSIISAQFSVAFCLKNQNIIESLAFTEKQLQSFSIEGTVTDIQGIPLPGVNIKIVETGVNTQTTIDGNYTIPLSAGTYTLEASYTSFKKQRVTGIIVTEGKITRLDIIMKESTSSLQEVVVTSSYKKATVAGLFALQKKTISFTDGISSEQIKQTSDNNVGQVLKRVAGITMQDNKFVVIRGMSERYNNVLLNGSSLPSTEPNRRNFSFDIIPTNLIDNVIVSKTFTPDMSGEFAGGTVQVNTLSVPQEKFLTLTIGSAYNTQSFAKDMYSNTRYKEDYFLGTNKRDWFKNGWYDRHKEVNEPVFNINDPLKAISSEVLKLSGEIPNHWGQQKFSGNPSQSIAIVGGMPFEFKNGNTLGFTAALNYRHDEEREDYDFRARFSELYSIEGIKSLFVTVAAGLFNTGWKNKNHRIDWRNLYNRRFTHDNIRQIDVDPIELAGFPTDKIINYLSIVKENTLWQSRIEGEHKLANKKITLNWFGDFNQIIREQPDDRYTAGFINPNSSEGTPNYLWILKSIQYPNPFRSSNVYASLLNEKKQNIGGNLEYSFKMSGNNQKLKTGYWGTFRMADFKQVLLGVTSGLNAVASNTVLPIQDRFSPSSFTSDILRYSPNALGSGGLQNKNEDNYDGTQNINAAYIMGDFSFFENKLHLIGGIRFEGSEMIVNTATKQEQPDGNFDFQDAKLNFKKIDWLPSATVTYDFLPSFKFRVAYSRTLARADFRERSPVVYFDVQERLQVSGKEGLQDPSTQNYDLRLEWYPSSSEIISVSTFRKYFKNPIEVLTTSTGISDNAYYVNLIDSTVKGIELNLCKHFGFFSKRIENLYLTGNFSLLKGSVTLGEVTLERNVKLPVNTRLRPPNGFAPINWNAGLSYNLDSVGASINYNYLGNRIRFAGATEFFDQYEIARGTLDAQLSFKLLNNKVELKFNASDLTAQPFIIYLNASKLVVPPGGGNPIEIASNGKEYNEGEDKVIRKSFNGTTYSFSVAYKF